MSQILTMGKEKKHKTVGEMKLFNPNFCQKDEKMITLWKFIAQME